MGWALSFSSWDLILSMVLEAIQVVAVGESVLPCKVMTSYKSLKFFMQGKVDSIRKGGNEEELPLLMREVQGDLPGSEFSDSSDSPAYKSSSHVMGLHSCPTSALLCFFTGNIWQILMYNCHCDPAQPYLLCNCRGTELNIEGLQYVFFSVNSLSLSLTLWSGVICPYNFRIVIVIIVPYLPECYLSYAT